MNQCEYGNITCPEESTTCVPKGEDDYYCKCKIGYKLNKGVREENNTEACIKKNKCEEESEICPKESTTCVPTNDDFYCKCKEEYQLGNLENLEKNKAACTKKCECGDHSYECRWSNEGSKICNCHLRYAQNNDTCSDCKCGEKGISCYFDERGNNICICQSGYAQRDKTCSAMCRSDEDCFNGGVCRYEGHGYFCNCKKHFIGDYCEANTICESMKLSCKAMGAVCVYMDWLEKGICECPPSKIFNRESQTCEGICHPNSCLNGKCEIVDYHHECRCDEGYEGDRCDKKIIKGLENMGFIVFFGLLFPGIFCFLVIAIICIQKMKNHEKS